MSQLSIENLSISFPGQPVLRNVSLHLEPNEIVSVIGPNGAGKSTLLRAIFERPRHMKGKITWRAGLKIGYMAQKLSLNKTLSLSVKNLMNLPARAPSSRIASVLHEVGAHGLEHASIHTLSGGELQRVLLARALLSKPDLLILDEPTAGLDQAGSNRFYSLISELREKYHTTILMVSHEINFVMRDSDRVICLNGHICCQGSPENVASTPEYRALFAPDTKEGIVFYKHDHDHAH